MKKIKYGTAETSGSEDWLESSNIKISVFPIDEWTSAQLGFGIPETESPKQVRNK